MFANADGACGSSLGSVCPVWCGSCGGKRLLVCAVARVAAFQTAAHQQSNLFCRRCVLAHIPDVLREQVEQKDVKRVLYVMQGMKLRVAKTSANLWQVGEEEVTGRDKHRRLLDEHRGDGRIVKRPVSSRNRFERVAHAAGDGDAGWTSASSGDIRAGLGSLTIRTQVSLTTSLKTTPRQGQGGHLHCGIENALPCDRKHSCGGWLSMLVLLCSYHLPGGFLPCVCCV